MDRPIFVTGGYGFLGSYVCRALAERGRRVIIYDLNKGRTEAQKLLHPYSEQVSFVQGSITDLSRLQASIEQEQVEAIVHAAAVCDAQSLFKEPYSAFDVNSRGTLNVLEAAHRGAVRRVVHASSVAAFAKKRYDPLDESHPVFDPQVGHPSGPYGASKAAAEIIGLAYWGAVGMDYIALRFSGIYGYGMNIPMYVKPMVELSLQGKPCHCSGGAHIRRSLLYVKDAAEATIRALEVESEKLRQRIFVVAGRQYEICEVAEGVRALIASAQIELGDSISEYESRRLENAGEFSVAQAAAQLGFRPKFDLEQGLADYIAMYREHER